MKKIPTVFEREYENHRVVGCTDKFTSDEAQRAFEEGVATVKYDGSCCCLMGGGVFYKRYDCKKGRKPPEHAIPCCDPDPVTGHWPHWVPVSPFAKEDKWFMEALTNSAESIKSFCACFGAPEDSSYEAVGPHFQGNPYGLEKDVLTRHGANDAGCAGSPRTYEGIKAWLKDHRELEGIVYWLDGQPVAKIKRTDFGYEWPTEESKKEEVFPG